MLFTKITYNGVLKIIQPYYSFILMVLILTVGSINISEAQDKSSDSLKRIAVLEKKVQELEKRISQLETVLKTHEEFQPTSNKPPKDVSGDWRNIKNWGLIKSNMSFDQVIKILGEPTRKSMITPDSGTFYYEGYSDEAGSSISGNILFYNRQVSLTSIPVF